MKRYLLGLVGESNYQAAVQRLRPGMPVTLAHEPDNKFDPDAIVVTDAAGETIGYAPRGGWVHRAILHSQRDLRARVWDVTGAGTPARGVVLEVFVLDSPEEMLPPFVAEPPRAAAVPAEEDWRTLAFPAFRDAGSWLSQRGGCFWAVVVLVALWQVGSCLPDSPPGASVATESPAAEKLSEAAVAECRDFLAKAVKSGLIVERPAPHRLNVEERLWAQLYARERDLTLQAVSCDLWQTSMSPGFDQFVVVYGAHSGKRIAMLTSVGMDRD